MKKQTAVSISREDGNLVVEFVSIRKNKRRAKAKKDLPELRKWYEQRIKKLQEQIEVRQEKIRQANLALLELEDEEQRRRTAACKTCQGRGWVHTFSTEIPKEGSDVCPDCREKEHKEAIELVKRSTEE